MRFKKAARVKLYIETSRIRAAVLASQRRKQEKFPLLGRLIAETQLSVDEVIGQRKDTWPRLQQARRDSLAAKWREGRRRLFSYGDNFRAIVRACWATCPYPADPTYFLSFLHSIDRGRIDPSAPGWRLSEEEAARLRQDFDARIEHMRELRESGEVSTAIAHYPAATAAPERVSKVRPQGCLTSGDHE